MSLLKASSELGYDGIHEYDQVSVKENEFGEGVHKSALHVTSGDALGRLSFSLKFEVQQYTPLTMIVNTFLSLVGQSILYVSLELYLWLCTGNQCAYPPYSQSTHSQTTVWELGHPLTMTLASYYHF